MLNFFFGTPQRTMWSLLSVAVILACAAINPSGIQALAGALVGAMLALVGPFIGPFLFVFGTLLFIRYLWNKTGKGKRH